MDNTVFNALKPPVPTPSDERAVKTDMLIRKKATDVERWSKRESLASQWDERAAIAAELIPADASVLDLGCGAMALRRFLKSGCKYFPADVVSRGPSTYVIDLNKNEFPPGNFDYIVMLGVVEYIHDARVLLDRTREQGGNLIVTYCTNTALDLHARRGMGWVNDFSDAEFQLLLRAAGWAIERSAAIKRGVNNIQMLFKCR